MTLIDNSRDYLRSLRDDGDHVLAKMDDGAIEREAMRMTNVLVEAREAFMTNDLDTEPEN